MPVSANIPPAGGWVPTKKWVAALVSGLLLIGVHAFASGGWDKTEWGELGALITAQSAAYVVKNDPTPGGVPLKKS